MRQRAVFTTTAGGPAIINPAKVTGIVCAGEFSIGQRSSWIYFEGGCAHVRGAPDEIAQEIEQAARCVTGNFTMPGLRVEQIDPRDGTRLFRFMTVNNVGDLPNDKAADLGQWLLNQTASRPE